MKEKEIVYIAVAKCDQTEYVDRHGWAAAPFILIADVFRNREDAERCVAEWEAHLCPEDKAGTTFVITERCVL